MRALKIFKPIYTLGIKSWHFRNYRFFVASVKIFPTHAPLNLVLNVEKKNIFFPKFEIREEIVVILSKTVILGLLPAPTTIIQILS